MPIIGRGTSNNRISRAGKLKQRMAEKKSNLEGLNVLLGVSGGVAAYKAVDLASKLAGAGAGVKTVMTENACRFVGPKSFEAVTRSQVYTTLWSETEQFEIGHITLAEWANVVVVAPATANIIGKIANGICDDLLSAVLCACRQQPKLLAPAMNENMWLNPAVQRNVKTLKQMGFELIGPEEGPLACGAEGIGRMSQPQDILKAIETIVSREA
jgi:phosphopantothenoylcysteine decarboxylase/phosphopantothenate--cysteine ligase